MAIYTSILKRRALLSCLVPIRAMSDTNSIARKFKPSNVDKRILVWTKKFKSIEEIPGTVSAETLERARSEARIKISNILMLLTGLSCIGLIISGKRAASRGESLHQQNLDWHKKYQEDYKKNNAEYNLDVLSEEMLQLS